MKKSTISSAVLGTLLVSLMSSPATWASQDDTYFGGACSAESNTGVTSAVGNYGRHYGNSNNFAADLVCPIIVEEELGKTAQSVLFALIQGINLKARLCARKSNGIVSCGSQVSGSSIYLFKSSGSYGPHDSLFIQLSVPANSYSQVSRYVAFYN